MLLNSLVLPAKDSCLSPEIFHLFIEKLRSSLFISRKIKFFLFYVVNIFSEQSCVCLVFKLRHCLDKNIYKVAGPYMEVFLII